MLYPLVGSIMRHLVARSLSLSSLAWWLEESLSEIDCTSWRRLHSCLPLNICPVFPLVPAAFWYKRQLTEAKWCLCRELKNCLITWLSWLPDKWDTQVWEKSYIILTKKCYLHYESSAYSKKTGMKVYLCKCVRVIYANTGVFACLSLRFLIDSLPSRCFLFTSLTLKWESAIFLRACMHVCFLQVPSQLFCGASVLRYFSVPGDGGCLIVLLWGRMWFACMHISCVFM